MDRESIIEVVGEVLNKNKKGILTAFGLAATGGLAVALDEFFGKKDKKLPKGEAVPTKEPEKEKVGEGNKSLNLNEGLKSVDQVKVYEPNLKERTDLLRSWLLNEPAFGADDIHRDLSTLNTLDEYIIVKLRINSFDLIVSYKAKYEYEDNHEKSVRTLFMNAIDQAKDECRVSYDYISKRYQLVPDNVDEGSLPLNKLMELECHCKVLLRVYCNKSDNVFLKHLLLLIRDDENIESVSINNFMPLVVVDPDVDIRL